MSIVFSDTFYGLGTDQIGHPILTFIY